MHACVRCVLEFFGTRRCLCSHVLFSEEKKYIKHSQSKYNTRDWCALHVLYFKVITTHMDMGSAQTESGEKQPKAERNSKQTLRSVWTFLRVVYINKLEIYDIFVYKAFSTRKKICGKACENKQTFFLTQANKKAQREWRKKPKRLLPIQTFLCTSEMRVCMQWKKHRSKGAKHHKWNEIFDIANWNVCVLFLTEKFPHRFSSERVRD